MTVGDAYLALELRDAVALIREMAVKIDRMEQTIERQGVRMATIGENVTALGTALDGLEEDVDRLLTALESRDLNTEEQAAVDALKARLGQLNTNMDAAVRPAGPTDPSVPTRR